MRGRGLHTGRRMSPRPPAHLSLSPPVCPSGEPRLRPGEVPVPVQAGLLQGRRSGRWCPGRWVLCPAPWSPFHPVPRGYGSSVCLSQSVCLGEEGAGGLTRLSLCPQEPTGGPGCPAGPAARDASPARTTRPASSRRTGRCGRPSSPARPAACWPSSSACSSPTTTAAARQGAPRASPSARHPLPRSSPTPKLCGLGGLSGLGAPCPGSIPAGHQSRLLAASSRLCPCRGSGHRELFSWRPSSSVPSSCTSP